MKHKKLCSLVCVCTISMVCCSAFAYIPEQQYVLVLDRYYICGDIDDV